MFQIDCSNIPTEITDFVFDHLNDDIENSDVLDIDYTTQIVSIDTGNMGLASEVKESIQSRAIEQVNDMQSELNRGYTVGFSKEELKTIESEIYNSSTFEITTKD
jgi:hypothetical protein